MVKQSVHGMKNYIVVVFILYIFAESHNRDVDIHIYTRIQVDMYSTGGGLDLVSLKQI